MRRQEVGHTATRSAGLGQPAQRAQHAGHPRRVPAGGGRIPDAEAIGCAPGAPGVYMSAYGYTFRDAPLSYQRIVIPPNGYELEILG